MKIHHNFFFNTYPQNLDEFSVKETRESCTEQGQMNIECVAHVEFCVSPKTALQKVLRIGIYFISWGHIFNIFSINLKNQSQYFLIEPHMCIYIDLQTPPLQ